MVQKYIIDKTDIHDLLTGKEIPLPQGKARAFCVEVAGKITNGEILCMMFPNMHYTLSSENKQRVVTTIGIISSFDLEWWNAPYRTESEEK